MTHDPGEAAPPSHSSFNFTLAGPQTPCDLEALQELEMAAGALYRSQKMDWVADAPPMTLTDLETFQKNGALWLVEELVEEKGREEGRPPYAAFAALGELQPGSRSLHLHEISVHPAYQGHGLGRRLMERLIAHAEMRNYHTLTLTTFTEVPWCAPFYETFGFVIVPENQAPEPLIDVLEEEKRRGLMGAPRCAMAVAL